MLFWNHEYLNNDITIVPKRQRVKEPSRQASNVIKLEKISGNVLTDNITSYHKPGQVLPTSSQPYSLHTPPSIKPDRVGGMHKYSPSPSTGYSGKQLFSIGHILGILNKEFFERRTSTGSEAFIPLTCLQMICPKR